MIAALMPAPALDVTYLLPRVELGEIHRPREVLRLAGGKALNIARAADVLGGSVRVVAPLGGEVGALVARLAADSGLDVDVVAVAGETRSCISAIPDDGAAPTEYYEPSPALTDDEWAAVAARFAALPADGWSVLAGSIPADVDPQVLTETLLGRRSDGDRIAIDSSGAGLAALVDAVRPELLKVNRTEAAELIGVPASGPIEELVATLRVRTGGIVVITDGAAGAVGADASRTWRAHPDPQPGRFAIGSGDSFLAGLLVGLDAGGSLADALHAASAAGSANTRVPGAAVFDREAYDAAFARIRVEPLLVT